MASSCFTTRSASRVEIVADGYSVFFARRAGLTDAATWRVARLRTRPVPAEADFGTDSDSRTTSVGDLSSRTPRNTGCRSFPSVVHSLNLISTTIAGFTQWARSFV